MLKGKVINLELLDKKDLPMLQEMHNNREITGDFVPIFQANLANLEKSMLRMTFYGVRTENGTTMGAIAYWSEQEAYEIGYYLKPGGRGKGYITEAIAIITDLLFMNKPIQRIEARVHVDNVASGRVLEKNGFKSDGILRMGGYSGGKWHDITFFSLIKSDWESPRVLL